MGRKHRTLGLFAATLVEEYAYSLDAMRVPFIRKRQERFIKQCFNVSNRIRRQVGLKPKTFKRLIDRNTVEVIT